MVVAGVRGSERSEGERIGLLSDHGLAVFPPLIEEGRGSDHLDVEPEVLAGKGQGILGFGDNDGGGPTPSARAAYSHSASVGKR
jgi:hypothetical protein